MSDGALVPLLAAAGAVLVERLSSPKNTAAVVQAAACHVIFQNLCMTVFHAYVMYCSKHENMHYGSQIAVVKINFDYRKRGLLQSSHFYIHPTTFSMRTRLKVGQEP